MIHHNIVNQMLLHCLNEVGLFKIQGVLEKHVLWMEAYAALKPVYGLPFWIDGAFLDV